LSSKDSSTSDVSFAKSSDPSKRYGARFLHLEADDPQGKRWMRRVFR
jgi:hypothetical protein